MDFIFVYVVKHNLVHLSQFFEHICMSQNRDTNNLDFHQSRDHEVSSCIEIANSSSSGEFLLIVQRYHCLTSRLEHLISETLNKQLGERNG